MSIALASFLFFLISFAILGISSSLKSRSTQADYYLASRSLRPSLVGLSAVATNNSGYMFIGIIGYGYANGLQIIWLMIGWVLGDFLASLFVHSRLQEASQRTGELSFTGLLTNWYGRKKEKEKKEIFLQKLIGIISLLFLLAGASGQLLAGSKALQVTFNWPHWAGACLGAAFVLLYCLAGGIRASIWTDVAQSVIMIIAMATLVWMGVNNGGGLREVIASMEAIPNFLSLAPKSTLLDNYLGILLFIGGWIFSGLSVIGQPHVMVRFMALKNNKMMSKAKLWYYLWYIFFCSLALMASLLSRLYFENPSHFDAELALPSMALIFLSPWFVGLVLAGIFAASMSTADSLILSSSSSLSNDLFPKLRDKNWHVAKVITFLCVAIALVWTLTNKQSVFNLVTMAWSGLGSILAPLLIALSLGKRPSPSTTIIAVSLGFGTALVWRYLGWHNLIYEGMPGILIGCLVYFLKRPKKLFFLL